MDNMKYIVLEFGGLEVPILFPSILNHADVANGREVISAGQVQLQGATGPLPDACVIVKCCQGLYFWGKYHPWRQGKRRRCRNHRARNQSLDEMILLFVFAKEEKHCT